MTAVKAVRPFLLQSYDGPLLNGHEKGVCGVLDKQQLKVGLIRKHIERNCIGEEFT